MSALEATPRFREGHTFEDPRWPNDQPVIPIDFELKGRRVTRDVKDRIAAIEKVSRGHVVERHGPLCTDLDLALRAVYCVDPVTGSTQDGFKDTVHTSAYEATRFKTYEAIVWTDIGVRLTEAYEVERMIAEHHNDERFLVKVPLADVFPGSSHLGHFEGRFADVNRDGEPIARPIDFSNIDRWRICAMFTRVYDGSSATGWELYTMYPASDVGQRRGVREAQRGVEPVRFDPRWNAPTDSHGDLRPRRPQLADNTEAAPPAPTEVTRILRVISEIRADDHSSLDR